MNQYERGKHTPGILMGQSPARVQQVPTSFLYEEDDVLASLIAVVGRPSREKKTLLAAPMRWRKNLS
jgi:hypothetical protein